MKIKEKMMLMMIKAKYKVDSFIHNEDGDTNFISILVILGIVLALAAIFLGFKDQILTWVDTNIGNFFSLKGGR